MTFRVKLDDAWRGWQVKLYTLEQNEEPHATLVRGLRSWRWSLRTGKFLDRQPDPKEVPDGLLAVVISQRDELVLAWDELHPINPVSTVARDARQAAKDAAEAAEDERQTKGSVQKRRRPPH
jgi:hypothetical protein